jgi:hypothetical protein
VLVHQDISASTELRALNSSDMEAAQDELQRQAVAVRDLKANMSATKAEVDAAIGKLLELKRLLEPLQKAEQVSAAHCLLPAARCLLPGACCPLSAAHCLLPAVCSPHITPLTSSHLTSPQAA